MYNNYTSRISWWKSSGTEPTRSGPDSPPKRSGFFGRWLLSLALLALTLTTGTSFGQAVWPAYGTGSLTDGGSANPFAVTSGSTTKRVQWIITNSELQLADNNLMAAPKMLNALTFLTRSAFGSNPTNVQIRIKTYYSEALSGAFDNSGFTTVYNGAMPSGLDNTFTRTTNNGFNGVTFPFTTSWQYPGFGSVMVDIITTTSNTTGILGAGATLTAGGSLFASYGSTAAATGSLVSARPLARFVFEANAVSANYGNCNFTGFTGANLHTVFPGWTEGTSQVGANVANYLYLGGRVANASSSWRLGGPSGAIALNLYGSSQGWLISPSIIANASSSFSYSLGYTTYNSSTAATTYDATDTISIYVTNNNGLTWNRIATKTPQNDFPAAGTTYVNFSESLSAYAGQKIMVALAAKRTSGSTIVDVDVVADNFNLTGDSWANLAFETIVSPAALTVAGTCANSATQSVIISLRNTGNASWNFGTNAVSVSVTATPPTGSPVTLTGSATGTLSTNGITSITLTPALDMSAGGTYTFTAPTLFTSGADGNSADNNIPSGGLSFVTSNPQNGNFIQTFALGTTSSTGWQSTTTPAFSLGTTTPTGNGLTAGRMGVATTQNTTSSLTSPRILGLGAQSHIRYDYNFSSIVAGSATTIQLQVSTNCGSTWTNIGSAISSTAQAAASTWYTSTPINISSYAGQTNLRFQLNVLRTGATANTVAIDNVQVFDFLPFDLAVTGLVAPTGTNLCPNGTQTLSLNIRNDGGNAWNFATDPVTFRVNAVSPSNVTTTITHVQNTGSLPSGTTSAFPLSSQTLNLSEAGTWTFSRVGAISSGTDGNAANNDLSANTVTVRVSTPAPFTQDFGNTAFVTPSGWTYASFSTTTTIGTTTSPTGRQGSGFGGAAASRNLSSFGLTGSITTSALTNITATSIFQYDYRWRGVTAVGTSGQVPVASDNIQVQVSTDCGTTFTTIATHTYGTVAEETYFTSPSVSLTAYANQVILLRLLATTSTTNSTGYFLTIDNVSIPVNNDLAIAGIAIPTAAGPNCASATQSVSVTLTNQGLNAWDFATNNVTVNVDITYPNATVLTRSATITSGSLAVGATANYVLSGTIDFTQSGNYSFARTGAIVAAADENPNNNNLASVTRTAVVATATPHFADFGTATSTPTNYSLTGFSVVSGVGNPGSAARINLYSSVITGNVRTALVGPIAANHSLNFSYTWSPFSTSTPANPGASDNIQVQVSTDCGTTFTTISTINFASATGSGVWASASQSLSAYDGQNIFVRIVGNWVTGDYYLNIDNIFIGNPNIPFCLATTNHTAPTHNSTNASLTPQFTWTAPAGPAPTGYRLYLGTDGDNVSAYPSTILNGTDLGNVLNYTVPGGTPLDPLTSYNWIVVPYGSGGNAANCFSAMRTFTTGDGKPSCIPTTGIAPANNSTDRPLLPTFTWAAPTSGTQPTGYTLIIGTTSGGNNILNVNLGNVLTYTLTTPLTVNTQYFWRVTPTNAQGTPVATCNTFNFTTTAVATPAQVTLGTPTSGATNISFSAPVFTWTPATTGNNATNFKFYLGTDGGGTSLPVNTLGPNGTLLGNVSTFTYSGIPLLKGTTYYWAVVARNSFGDAVGTPTIRSFTTGFDPLLMTTAVSSATFNSIMGTGSNLNWRTVSFTDDDEGMAKLSLQGIGMTGFTYQGISIDTIDVGINGFIRLNGTVNSSSFTNGFSSTTPGYLAPFWDDLQTKTGTGGNNNSSKYLLTGTSGNRVLTIEWNDIRRYLNPAASLNFQVKLYEADGRIEFVYGTMALFNGNASAAYDYTLGISALGISSTPVTNEIISQQFATVNNFGLTSQNSLAQGPLCGTMVSFTPSVSANLGTDPAATVSNTTAATSELLPVTSGSSSISFCRVRRTALATQTVNVCGGAAPPDDAAWFRFDVTAQTAGQSFVIVANGAGGMAPVIQLFSDAGVTLHSGTSCSNIATAGNTATLSNTSLAQGTYWFRVYNQGTGIGSGLFAVSVYNLVPPPANDNCSGAVTLTLGAAVTNGTFAEATASAAPAACSGLGGNPADDDVWYTFVAGTAATTISYQPQAGVAMQIEAWTSDTCIRAATSTTLRNCLATSTIEGQGGAVALVTVPGSRYYLRCYNRITGIPFSANYGFTIGVSNRAVPANDNCPGAVTVTVGGSTVNANLFNAMPSAAPAGCSGTADDDIWYKFTATSTSTILNYSYSTGQTLSAEVWLSDTCITANTATTGRTCLSMSAVAGSINNEATLTTVVGANYYIRFYNPIAGDPAAGVGTTFSFRLTNMPAFTWTTALSNNAAYVSIANDPAAQSFTYQSTSLDDVLSNPVDLTALGFNGFAYQGNTVTSFIVSSNGFLTFNTGSTNTGITNLLASNVRTLAPLWDDLYLSGLGQPGSIKYLVSGTSPNQVLTVEWIELETFTNQGPSLNFQIKLYEADDRIEFNYGNIIGFNGTNIRDYTYSLGLSGRLSGQVVSQQSPRVRNFGTTENTNLDIVPSCNSRVTFTPAVSNNLGSDAALSYSNISCNSATALTVGNGVSADLCRVFRSTAAGAATSPTDQNNGAYFSFNLGVGNTTTIVVNGGGNFAPYVELLSNCNTIFGGGSATAFASEGQTATLTVPNLPAGSYFVRVYDDPTSTLTSKTAGIFSISVYTVAVPPANDECSGATVLTLPTLNLSSSTKNATGNHGIPTLTYTNGGVNPADDDVWFSFTATATNPQITVTGGTGFIPAMEIFSGVCPDANVTNRVNFSTLVASASGGTTTTTLSATVGTVYFIRVFHRGTGTPANPEAPFTISVANVAPACPTYTAPNNNITNADPTFSGSQALTWTAPTGVQGTVTYDVYFGQTNPPAFVANVSALTYNATGLVQGGTYFWQVRTNSSTNGVSSGCTVRQFTTALQPGVPTCVTVTAPAANASRVSATPTITWNAVTVTPPSAITYNVEISTSNTFPNGSTLSSGWISSTSYTVPNGSALLNNTNYFYRVTPRNASFVSPQGCLVRSFSTISANDNCIAAVSVTPSSSCSSPVSGDSRNSTQSLVQCAGPSGAANDDVWYKFVATSTLHVISVTGGTNAGELKNPVIQVFDQCNGTSLGCSNDATGAFESITVSNLTIGATYVYRTYSASALDADAGTFTTCVLGTSSFNGGSQSVSGTFGNVNVGPGTVLTITGNTTVATMTVQSGATLVIDPGVVISGTAFILSPGSTLQITDAQGITVAGVPQGPIRTGTRTFSSAANYVYNNAAATNSLGSALPNIVNNLTLNASSAATFTPSGATGISGVLTVGDNATLSLGSTSFTIASTATGTARIAPLGTGNVTGTNITVNRFLPRLSNPVVPGGWLAPGSHYMVGSPVTNATINGFATGGNTLSFSASGPSVYSFLPASNAWSAITNGATPLAPGRGVRVWFRTPFFVNGSSFFSQSGPVTTGNLSVSYPAGFNIAANPYPSPIDFSLLNRTNVNNSFWIWNFSILNYVNVAAGVSSHPSLQPGTILASGQGFFVQASSAGSIDFEESDKVSSLTTSMTRQGSVELMRVKIASTTTSSVYDMAAIAFRPNASVGLEAAVDGLKMEGSLINISTEPVAGVKMAVNSMPQVTTNTILPININSSLTGAHSLSFQDMGTMNPNVNVFLVDNFLGTVSPVSEGSSYAFDITADPATFGSGRFQLVFTPQSTTGTKGLTAAAMNVFPNPSNGSDLGITLAGFGDRQVSVIITDMIGKVVYNGTMQADSMAPVTNKLPVHLRAGIYNVSCSQGDKAITTRLVVNP